MKISVIDFRCFHKTSPVEIRPINLLVGENSAGKTSFLAATRFLMDLISREGPASFNKRPFQLGAYNQIAHLRGGRFGRAKSFSFELSGDLPRLRRRESHPDFFSEEKITGPTPREYRIKISFIERKTQPKIEYVEFRAGSYGFCVFSDSKTKSFFITPDGKRDFDDRIMERTYFFDEIASNLSHIEYIIRDYQFFTSRHGDLISEKHVSEASYISRLFRSSFRALPKFVYASSPVRSKPDRTYNPSETSPDPEGSHTPFILAQLSAFDHEKWSELQESLSEFGKASGLFQSVNVKQLGKTPDSPFQIMIETENRKSNIIDVGYGVSQVLPIISDLIRSPSNGLFLFQQPEVHLHPKAQAELASFIGKIVKKRRHTVLLETHSDYIIDRLRIEVRDGILRPEDLSLLYFSRRGPDVNIANIYIDKNGNLIGAPPEYRIFFLEEEMRSFGISE